MDFDGWAQRGNRGWGYADDLALFLRRTLSGGWAAKTCSVAARASADHRPSTGATRCARPSSRARCRWHPRKPGTTTARLQGGRELRAAHHPERTAPQRGAWLPASGDEAPQSHGAQSTRTSPRSSWRASVPSGCANARVPRRAPVEVRAAKEVIPERRAGELAAAPAGLGNRAGRRWLAIARASRGGATVPCQAWQRSCAITTRPRFGSANGVQGGPRPSPARSHGLKTGGRRC